MSSARPVRKPANMMIRREDGREVVNPTARSLRLEALCAFLETEAASSGDELILIDTDSRDSWTVTPDGHWR